jgi:glycosyltransferase involved in cell wall biosynthesis
VVRRIVVLDSHQFDDNRISKHIRIVKEKYGVFRINVNFYPDRATPDGDFDNVQIVNSVPTKNPYLNGLLFAFKTTLGGTAGPLEKRLRNGFLRDGDEVIFHTHDPYLLGLAIKMRVKFEGSSIIYDRHEYYETWKNRWGFSAPGFFEKWYGKKVTELVFVSRNVDLLPKVFSGKPVSVVPNYPLAENFDKGKVEKKLQGMDSGDDILAVYFGVLNLNFDRDIRLMYRLMRSVMEARPNVRFTVAGRVYDKEARALMDALVEDFGGRMLYLGEIPYKEVVERTQGAHLGFFFLRPDSLMWCEDRPVSPNKVYEYLLSGTVPIIRATLDDCEAIEKCSLTFDKDSTFEDILDGVLKLIDDRERMKRMMKECYDTGLEFSWEKVAPRYFECYERLFGSMDRGNQ